MRRGRARVRRAVSGDVAHCALRRRACALLVLALAALGSAGCREGESAVARGDRLWADSNYQAALAEYRLALRQSGDERALGRVAHAYAVTGDFERAREQYGRLLERAPEHTDQALLDYVLLARRAQQRGDRYGMAGAVEAALALRPQAPVVELALPLARYYADVGEIPRALEFFERALAALPPDSLPRVLYEIGLLHERQGNCREAIGYFQEYAAALGDVRRITQDTAAPTSPGGERPGVRTPPPAGGPERAPLFGLGEPVALPRTLPMPPRIRGESTQAWQERSRRIADARWHQGNCALTLARGARERGQLTDAQAYLDMVVELGVPENVQDEAWFLRGEILFALGRMGEALASYERVLELNPARTGLLVDQARRRMDEIRY